MRNEIRYALRSISRDRAFAAMVVLSLALGIGANTAIFSMVNGVLMQPPAYREPARLVAVNQIVPKFAKAYPALPVNPGILLEWRKQAKSFESIGALEPNSFDLTGVGEPELISGAAVSANFFHVLGVQPRLGRSFVESEDWTGHDRVAVIADSLWKRRLHSDPNIIGRKIMLNGRPYEVIGVMPAGFRSFQTPLFGSLRSEKAEIFKPIGYDNDDLKLRVNNLNYWVVARLGPGVTLSRAQAELNAVQHAISAQIQGDFGLQAGMKPLLDQIVGGARQGLVLLMAAVGAVLLVLCVNLANLSLARAAGRSRDSAIRTALGASRGRLVRQNLVESLILSLTGGVLGVILAAWGLRALVAAAPIDLPRLHDVHLDWRVLLFAVLLSLGTGLLFGILPALRSAASSPFETLKAGSRTNTEGRQSARVRNSLVSLEVGLSAALLVTAGLLMASFTRLMTMDKGFDVERVIAADIALPGAKYPKDTQRTAFYQRVLEQVRSLPGVQQVSMTSALPLQGETWIDMLGAEGDTRPEIERPSTNVRFVSPGYFQALHIPLRDGRDFAESDHGRKVTVLSAGLAQKIWPGQNALGRKVDNGSGKPIEVVGITPDIRSTSLDQDPVNMMYLPYWQNPQYSGSLLVRTAMDPRGIAGALRSAVWSVDSEVPVPEIRTMEQVMVQSVGQRRFQMLLVLLFAAGALGLAAFGTYGVVSYAVTRRRAEMGIRMALGAERGDLLRMVLRQGMTPVFAGLGAGVVAALAVGSYLSSLLFQVSPRDPVAFATACGVLLLVSAAACLIPARRATRVNPIDALRFE
jgi:putative ABC transport system permease protein